MTLLNVSDLGHFPRSEFPSRTHLSCNFSIAVWVGYIALFGIAVETGVVMVVYLHEGRDRGPYTASGRS